MVNVLTGALLANTLECPTDAKRKTGKSKNRRLQEAFAAHLRQVGRSYPSDRHPQVVLLIANAPWHAGQAVTEALTDHPHLELKCLPSYSPKLKPIERFWKALRRRATHNRLFDTLTDLKRSLRNTLRYFQTMRQRLKSLVNKPPRAQKIRQS